MQTAETHMAERRQRIEHALNFATDAYAAFENGGVNDKRNIFSTMRLNATLEGKKLALQSPFWRSFLRLFW